MHTQNVSIGNRMDPQSVVLKMHGDLLSRPGECRRATEGVARRCGLGFWTVERIRRGQAKRPSAAVVERLIAGYESWLAERLRRAAHEERWRCDFTENGSESDLRAAEELLARLAARKAR